ncbi:MAG: hypothetical protein HY271_16250 [Deltaproteobacteria bacterium]|nr:hypothetical protein [Deltaproteobacteria bacterium]
MLGLAARGGAVVPPGASDPGQAGHAVKCQKMLDKGVAKYLAAWTKIYSKCVGAIAACVQTKASDPACLSKAVTNCNEKIPALNDENEGDLGLTLLEDPAVNFCGSLTLTNQLDAAGGILYNLRADECKNRFGIPSIASGIGSIAFCLFKETDCAAEKLFLAQMPRAHHLLDDAGIVVGHAVGPNSCLSNVGGSGALADAKAGKTLLSCQNGVAKAGKGFASKARGALAKCAGAVFACAQTKPTQKCVDTAGKTCAKQLAAVDAAELKLEDTVAKKCEKTPLSDLLDANGGDVSGLAALCDSVGVASVDSVATYASCLGKHERCQVEDSIRFTSPRINELLAAAGLSATLPSAFCPAP